MALETLPDRFILREGKTPRHPYKDGNGDHTDPRQYLSLYKATAMSEDRHLGVGFVPDNRCLVLDFDHVVVGGKIEPDILEVIKSLPPSYAEYSPSGTGLHFFYRIDGPTYDLVKSANIRLQFSPTVAIDLITLGRYVTVTGLALYESRDFISNLSVSSFNQFLDVSRKFTQRYQPSSDSEIEKQAATLEQMEVWRQQLRSGETHNVPTYGLIYNFIIFQQRDDSDAIEAEIHELMRDSPAAGEPAWVKNQRHTVPRLIRECMRIRNEIELKRQDLNTARHLASQFGSAEISVKAFGERLAYIPQYKSWYYHQNRHFISMSNEGLHPLVFNICDDYFKGAVIDANDKGDPKVVQEYIKWRIGLKKYKCLDDVIKLMQGLTYTNINEFEPLPYYLNTESGIVDLRNGSLHQHDPKYKMLQICGCHYAPGMATPIWDQFLSDVCCGDTEMVEYLVAVLGYLITGETKEHKFFSLYGDGGNGKSTLMNLLQFIMGAGGGRLGSQMMTAKASSFAMGKHDTDNDYFAFLALCKTSRILVCQEAGGGRRLDDERIKAITGGDRIIARPLFGLNFEYDPMFKLVFTTNDRLNVSGSDEGIWRRAVEFNFKADFKGANRDINMLDRLKAEAPGILGKLVASAMRYYSGGLPQPAEAVSVATAQWKYDADPISRFVAEEIERTNNPDDFIFSDIIWHRFIAWKTEEGSTRKIEKQGFSETLKKYQLTAAQKKIKGKKGRGYTGIRWVNELPDIPDDGPEF